MWGLVMYEHCLGDQRTWGLVPMNNESVRDVPGIDWHRPDTAIPAALLAPSWSQSIYTVYLLYVLFVEVPDM